MSSMPDDCPFRQPDPQHCWCGSRLTGRQRTFCSKAHARELRASHRWTQAKDAKKKSSAWYLCANATVSLEDNAALSVYGPLGCEGMTQKPEVNHKIPCMGKHGEWGCHHHSNNLEVLCPPCHKKITANQAAERAKARRDARDQ